MTNSNQENSPTSDPSRKRRNSRVSSLDEAAADSTTASASAAVSSADTNASSSNKIKKARRTRKPRRIIPDNKAYIPEDEQPKPADVVGGRGGEFFPLLAFIFVLSANELTHVFIRLPALYLFCKFSFNAV